MATKLTRLTHKIAIQLHLVADSCTFCSSRSRRPVRKLLDTPSYAVLLNFTFRSHCNLYSFAWNFCCCEVHEAGDYYEDDVQVWN